MGKKRPLWRRVKGDNNDLLEYNADMHIAKLHVWRINGAWFASVHLTCGYTSECKETFKTAIAGRRWAESDARNALITIRDTMVREYDLDIRKLEAAIKKRTPKRRRRRKTA
jgi:hypothetical protein